MDSSMQLMLSPLCTTPCLRLVQAGQTKTKFAAMFWWKLPCAEQALVVLPGQQRPVGYHESRPAYFL